MLVMRLPHTIQCVLPPFFSKSSGEGEQLHEICFHRLCKRGIRALNNSESATCFFQLLKDIESSFGGGQGRMLDRQLATVLGER